MVAPKKEAKKANDYNLDFQKNLDKKNEETKSRLQKAIASIERQIITLVSKTIDDPDYAGRKERVDQTMKTRNQLVDIFQEYYDVAAGTVRGYDDEAQAVKEYLEGIDTPAEFSKVDKDIIKALQQLSYGEFENLGATFQKKIGDEIYRGVLTQKSIKAIVESISNDLTGIEDKRGRPMTQYAGQIAHDELMKFSRGFMAQKAVDLGLKKFQYLGSLIKDSRDFCVKRAGGIFTFDEIQEWEDIDWDGKDPTAPVMISCGGYNCRHTLVPMTDDTADFISEQSKIYEEEDRKIAEEKAALADEE
jgi:hypothetical protein